MAQHLARLHDAHDGRLDRDGPVLPFSGLGLSGGCWVGRWGRGRMSEREREGVTAGARRASAYLDAVGVVALLDGGHGDTDDALRAGELVVDREDVRLVDLVGGRLLLQDLLIGVGS